MTWVIGGIIPFGYGVGLSDIRVTFSDGTHDDCLQKLYPIEKFIAAGFAGSVKIGFFLLHDLSRFLHLDAPDSAWIPEWVALNWWRRAKRIFQKFPQNEQKLKASILMVGIHPTINNGDSSWPKGTVCVFESPNFEPKFSRGLEFFSIGSGKYIEAYKKELHRSTQLHGNPLIQAEVGSIGGWGHAIKTNLTQTIKDNPDATVSEHLHILIAKRGEVLLGNNDHTTYANNSVIEFRMPWVAQSYSEFVKYCENRKKSGALATC